MYIITMVLLKVRHTGLIVGEQYLQFSSTIQHYSSEMLLSRMFQWRQKSLKRKVVGEVRETLY